MKYRKIGKSDLEVSEISFGCWTMGGPNWSEGNPIGWADVDEDEVTSAIKAALDAGVNHFDTADIYGNGKSERMLARCLDRLGVKSEDVVIATKVGHLWGSAEHPFEPAHIRHQCEQSLINLKRDAIDLYYFHHANFGEDDRYRDDAVATMNALVAEGKVRVKGLSAYSADDFVRHAPVVEPEALQSWSHILDDQYIREGSPVQRLMNERGMTFVAFSPLAQGRLLAKFDPANPPTFEEGDNRKNSPRFKKEALEDLWPRLEKLKARFGEATEDLAAVALNYILAHAHVACVIPGFRNERQARCNIAAAGRELNSDDLAYIRDAFKDLKSPI